MKRIPTPHASCKVTRVKECGAVHALRERQEQEQKNFKRSMVKVELLVKEMCQGR